MTPEFLRIVAALLQLLFAEDEKIDGAIEGLDIAMARGEVPPETCCRLLAVAFPRMQRSSRGTPLREWAARAYLTNWATNHLLFGAVAPVLGALEGGKCRPVLLKGAALIVSDYHDLGVRCMGDVDILVDSSRAEQAWRILCGAGASPERRGSLSDFHAIHAAHHAWQFTLPGGGAVDLHWSPLVDCVSPALAERFLASSQVAPFRGIATRVPSPEHRLLQACVHGAHRDPWAPWRWVIDALTVLRRTPDLNWRAVREAATASHLEHAFDAALSTVRAIATRYSKWDGVASSTSASLRDRVELWAWRGDELSFRATPIARIVTHLSRYLRLRRFHPEWGEKGMRDYWRLYCSEKGW